MESLFIGITNACNRRCLHCLRNTADPPGFFPLDLARNILPQAWELGFRTIGLTGGEIALYPDLEEFLTLVVDQGFLFNLVTNGHRFRENLLPVLSIPKIRERLTVVCFSLDGARAETHDALRGRGSFREVVEAATLCQFSGIPFCFKSVITNFNKGEITDLALLGVALGAEDLAFLQTFPSPRSIREGVIPDPGEIREILDWIGASLAETLRIKIIIEGLECKTILFSCPNVLRGTYLDFQGNLCLCCNLAQVARKEGQPSVYGKELLADMREVSLREGLIRHYQGVAQLMEARLLDGSTLKDLTFDPCYWCYRHFGKLDWLKDFPESPWSAGMLEEGKIHAGA